MDKIGLTEDQFAHAIDCRYCLYILSVCMLCDNIEAVLRVVAQNCMGAVAAGLNATVSKTAKGKKNCLWQIPAIYLLNEKNQIKRPPGVVSQHGKVVV